MFRRKKKSHISIEFNDYVLRFLVMKGSDLSQAKVMEIAIPEGVIEESDVKDELTLYELLKNMLQNGGRKTNLFVLSFQILLFY